MNAVLDALLNQPLSIGHHGAAATDEYGNEVPGALTWADTTGYLELASSREDVTGRDTTTARFRVWLRPDVALGPLDVVRFQGVDYQVDGQPERCWDPDLALVSHIRAELTAVVGG